MESGPAIFSGAVFALFGAVLLGWTALRARRREPVALGVRQSLAAALATGAAVGSLALGTWCLTRL
ncbi:MULTISPECIES: hypothetical protein [unclassified Streptomyces]|uniref:hypothetical protein n=1 Tax=unclassified Streptomyces TaxID=2593676 RepID=UPI0007DDA4C8|nr:hypothetical protein [Streptomyces sp. SAT1]ANH92673.1 hypothetical protein A8713_17180 [Streptomyces sp. SAT1]MYR62710.1 hypothetical protein [Streptomyces sp. SID625]